MIHPAVARYLAKNAAASGAIEPGRRAELGALTRFIRDRRDRGQSASIVFICTHNSRRSQMAQVWAHIAADYYGVAPVATFSGGSEVTACHPNTLAALTRAGLTVAEVTAGNNPICLLHYRDDGEPIRVFSKRFDDTANPTADFCAVMTCAQADTACPVVSGASLRLALTYEDPKAADGSRDEASVYDARCRQICRELLFVFSTLATTTSPATIDR